MLAQFDGLVAGYHMRHSVDPVAFPFMSRRDFVFLNGNGELYDLIARQPQMPDLTSMRPHELFVQLALAGRCSALITVSRTPPYSCCLLLLHPRLRGKTRAALQRASNVITSIAKVVSPHPSHTSALICCPPAP